MAESSRQLSEGDKEFIKLIGAGGTPSASFREAYPDHEAVRFWTITKGDKLQHQKAQEVLKDAAKNKLRAQYIQRALMTYQDKMEEFSTASLDTAIELVKGARSEKVRADLAIEGIRHKIGTPVQKVAVQEQKTVILTFGKRPAPSEERDVESVVEAELVSDELDGS